MDGGLLSLKWNNHRSTFFYVLSNVRKKECYTDVTLACDGKFYPVHKLVLSTCSEYFEQMFEQTQCKHPVIVLKDIRSEELESLLSYMYVGEVNVVQEKLSGLIKAAECLRIKGLAVPDEEPCSKPPGTSREKRSSDNSLNSEPKRRRQDDSGNTSSFRQAHSNNRNDDRRKSLDHPSSSTSNKFRNTNNSNSNVNSSRASSGDRETGDRGSTSSRTERLSSPASNNQHHAAADVKTEEQAEATDAEALEEVMIEPSPPVKEEPTDTDAVYLSDSNSVPDHKEEVLLETFSDAGQQQHFMDELLGHASESSQGNMVVGDFSEGGEGSSGAGGQQQQHMVSPRHQDHRPDAVQTQQLSYSEVPSSQTRTLPSGHGGFSSHHIPGQHSSFSTALGLSSLQVSHSNSSGERREYKLPFKQRHRTAPGTSVPVLPYHLLPDIGPVSSLNPYSCPVCNIKFHNKGKFRNHYMVHTGEQPYACSLCSFRSRQLCNMKRHVREKHELSQALGTDMRTEPGLNF